MINSSYTAIVHVGDTMSGSFNYYFVLEEIHDGFFILPFPD